MTTAPIPFGQNQESGQSELAGASPQVMNLVVDSKGAIRRRPGIKAYAGAPSTAIDAYGISGMYATSAGQLYAVGNHPSRKAFYRVLPGGAVQLSAAGKELVGTQRPTFAETEAMLAVTTGAGIRRVIFAGLDWAPLGGSPPAASSHVIANNNRLLSNDLGPYKNQVFFSNQAAGTATSPSEDWVTGTAGFVSADARPDPIVALWENSNQVFAFGSTTTQILVPDPTLVYASSITREYGCMAPYSVIKFEGGFAWLDHMKRFVAGSGSGNDFKPISQPIQNDLDVLDTTGCYGYRVQLGISDVLVWTLPVSGRTYVYSVGTGWSQWSGWNDAANNWQTFKALSYFQRPDFDVPLVGTSDGKIGTLDQDTSTDLGERIVASSITGFQSHDTSKLKLCTAVRLMFKPVSSVTASEPTAWLSWRDGMGDFCNPLAVDLTTSPVVQFRGLGTYRTREWKLVFSGTDEFELAGVEEDYDVLGA